MRCDSVRFDHFKFGIEIGRQKIRNESETRVVDENIRIFVFYRVAERENAVSFGQIAYDRFYVAAEFLFQFFESVLSPRGQNERRSARRKTAREFPSEARTCACYDRFHLLFISVLPMIFPVSLPALSGNISGKFSALTAAVTALLSSSTLTVTV